LKNRRKAFVRKLEDSNRNLERMTRLSDLSMALSAGLDLDILLRKMAVSVRETLEADESYFLLLNSETFELVLAAASGKRRKRPTRIKCPDRRSRITTSAEFELSSSPKCHDEPEDEPRLTGESLLLRNTFVGRKKIIFSRELLETTIGPVVFSHAIILPLMTASQTLGLLVVSNISKNVPFSQSDLEEAGVYANLAAMAVEHHKLIIERENRIKEMEKLNTLAKRFSTVQTLEGLIGLSFEYLGQIISSDLGVVSLFSGNEETRYYVATRPLSPKNLDNLTRHLKEIAENIRGQPSKVVKSQQIFLPSKDGPPLGNVFLKKIKSFITIPLTVQGQSIGLINLSSSKDKAFQREHFRAFTTLASLLATAIENVKIRLYLERRYDELSVLFEISKSLSSTLNLEEVLDSIVNFAMEMMNALHCELRLLNQTGDFLEVKAARGLSNAFLHSTPIKVGEGILGSVIANKQPVSVVDIRKDPRTKYLDIVKREKLVGLLSVPILQRGKPVGIITVYTSKPRDFTQNEIDLLSVFASQASVAIENARLYEKMKDQYLSMVMALAAAIETKDSYTHGHSQKVMEYAVKIAREMDLSEDEIEKIKYAGILHDIGKIGIRDAILAKQEKLTAAERSELRNHPQYGAFIMERVEFLKDIAPLTLYHHEKFDGTGYPLGLKGEAIPLGARILAVADTFDSMIADRPYRKAFPFEEVVKEMKKVSGTQLDPAVVEVFLNILKRERNRVS